MMFKLKNDILELTADTHGAEILSVKRDSGTVIPGTGAAGHRSCSRLWGR